MSAIHIKYGDSVLDGVLPDSWQAKELLPIGLPAANDPAEAVREALSTPIGSAPLADVLAGAGNLVVTVSDKTRVTRIDVVLPHILAIANAAGIPDEQITIIMACGTHAGHTDKERAAIVGAEVAARVRLLDHDCNAPDLVSVGTTRSGTPVAINRIAHEADRLIITGCAQFHYFAGFGGGRKGILPGISAEQTIIANHSHTIAHDGGRNPSCTTGRLDGNPLSEDMIEGARLVSADFLVNTVLTSDREIAAVFAGHWEQAHRAACEEVLKHYAVPIDNKADIVITTPGGYPKDINYIQSHKAYDNAYQAVKPGGTIILAAECRDGLGSPILRKWLGVQTTDEHEQGLRDHFQITGHTALAHRLKAQAVRTLMVTEMDNEELALLRVESAADLQDAIDKAAEKIASDSPTVYIMPNGYGTLPEAANKR